MMKSNYRPEIDGLRALAVIAVLLFHLGLGFPGGFIGVDVFFVISGFLITGIIRRGLQDGTFSLMNFWERRIRRIFPAMFVVLTSTLTVGYWLLLPDELKDLGKSAIAQCLLLANVYFWQDTGYFAGPAELKPLLHTWSLAVEEQFYLLFPFLLVLTKRLSNKRLFWLLALFSFISLIYSIYGTLYEPDAAFYLLPMRAWELLVGCMLAVLPLQCEAAPRRDNMIAATGFLAILLPIFFYSSETLFPGLAAILPVLGTAAFIFATDKSPATFSGKMLSQRAVVFVGLISYSLYLWHWPVIVYVRTYWGYLGWSQIVIALVCSFSLSVLTWKMVETPFRRKSSPKRQSRVFSTVTVLFTLFVVIATAVTINISLVKTNGMSSRLTENTRVFYEDMTWEGLEFVLPASPEKPIQITDLPSLGSKSDKTRLETDFVVWGDSHGMFLSRCIDSIANQFGLSGKAVFCPGCPPLPNIYRTDIFSVKGQLLINQEIVKLLDQIRPRNLILIARWSQYTNGPTEKGGTAQEVVKIISDDESQLHESELPADVIERNLRQLIDFCQARNITLWIVKQVPETGESMPAREWLLFKSGKRNTVNNRHRTLTDHQEQQAKIEKVFQSVQSDSLRFVDPAPFLFDDDQNTINYQNGRALYRDNDHLTSRGAEAISPLFKEMFRKIAFPSSELPRSAEKP
ncbi:acyltransferase family protein [Gimesia sp.]|uniref:acyltransferase family protein n=1 Tax=Gimesia sp. TaxID=2024833 RepID=UPI003A93CC5B